MRTNGGDTTREEQHGVDVVVEEGRTRVVILRAWILRAWVSGFTVDMRRSLSATNAECSRGMFSFIGDKVVCEEL